MKEYLVRKAGGTTTGSNNAFEKLGCIIREEQRASPSLTQVLVVSAFNLENGFRTTDTIREMIKCAYTNSGKSDDLYDELKFQLENYLDMWGIPKTFLGEELVQLDEKRRAQFGNKAAPRDLDQSLIYGEKIAAKMAVPVLSDIGVRDVVHVFPEELGMITNGVHQDANLERASYVNIADFFAAQSAGTVFVLEGFYGVERQGLYTTFSRGGSDLTATIVGNSVHETGRNMKCNRIEIWTDSAGIRTANPSVIEGTYPVEALSYEEALVLSMLGGKIIHHRAVTPAKRKKIPIFIGDPKEGMDSGTMILSEEGMQEGPVFKTVTSLPVEYAVCLKTPEMYDRHGFMSSYHKVFADLGISTKITVEGMYSAATFFDIPDVLEVNGELLKEDEAFERIKASLMGLSCRHEVNLPPSDSESQPLTPLKDLAIVGVIGNFTNKYGVAARIHQIVADNEINIMTRIPSCGEPHISFAVDRKDELKALKALHDELFGGKKCQK